MDPNIPGGKCAKYSLGLAIRSRAYCEALALFLRASDDFVVTDLGEGPVEKIIERLIALAPDVALFDLRPADGAALIRETHRAMPAVRIIALNQEDDKGGGDTISFTVIYPNGGAPDCDAQTAFQQFPLFQGSVSIK